MRRMEVTRRSATTLPDAAGDSSRLEEGRADVGGGGYQPAHFAVLEHDATGMGRARGRQGTGLFGTADTGDRGEAGVPILRPPLRGRRINGGGGAGDSRAFYAAVAEIWRTCTS